MGASLLFLDGKFYITGVPFEDNEIIKAIAGASFSSKVRCWGWQADYKTYKSVKISFPDINISSGVQTWVDRHLKAVERMKNIKALEPKLVNPITERLYPYQKVGVNFMVRGVRVICGDDMGVGKTCQSIVAAEEVNAERVLIVTPNSVKFNWELELLSWGTKNITIINGNKKEKRKQQIEEYKDKKGYLVINYEGVRLHPELQDIRWDVMILDEAHRIKNRKAMHTEACKKMESKYCWLLSGTPMENKPAELWSLLNMLFPKSFSSYWKFIEQYCVIKEIEARGKAIKIPEGAISSKEMNELLQPIMIRRLKTEVLPDLPEKQYISIPVEMNMDDKRVYKDILKDMIAVLETGEISATPTVIAQFTRLKQICISQHLLGTKRNDVKSAKLDALEELVEDMIESHKIVIFTSFAQALKIVVNNFNARGWQTAAYYGENSPEERQVAIDGFVNNPDIRVFIATIQAGGTGIDGLQHVSDVTIFLDKHPNPMKNLQAEDRSMRIGQKNALTIYSIINKDSIEEYVEYKLLRKETAFNHIVDGKFVLLDKYFSNIAERWNS